MKTFRIAFDIDGCLLNKTTIDIFNQKISSHFKKANLDVIDLENPNILSEVTSLWKESLIEGLEFLPDEDGNPGGHLLDLLLEEIVTDETISGNKSIEVISGSLRQDVGIDQTNASRYTSKVSEKHSAFKPWGLHYPFLNLFQTPLILSTVTEELHRRVEAIAALKGTPVTLASNMVPDTLPEGEYKVDKSKLSLFRMLSDLSGPNVRTFYVDDQDHLIDNFHANIQSLPGQEGAEYDGVHFRHEKTSKGMQVAQYDTVQSLRVDNPGMSIPTTAEPVGAGKTWAEILELSEINPENLHPTVIIRPQPPIKRGDDVDGIDSHSHSSSESTMSLQL